MEDIVIVGAGGFAREMYEIIIKDINKQSPTWNVLGCIDDDPNALDGKKTDLRVLGRVIDWDVTKCNHYAMGIANPVMKEKVSKLLLARGAHFVPIIHPNVRILAGASYGIGLVAYPGAVLGPDVKIGDFLTLLFTGLGHDAQIGNYCTISGYCGINGYVKIGDRVFIGGHAVVAPNLSIGDDAYVGVGSVVVSKIKPNTRVFGNPARKMDF